MSNQNISVKVTGDMLAMRRTMSQGEKAAREYLGRKQIERNLRIDRIVVFALACLAIAGIVTPFLIMGNM